MKNKNESKNKTTMKTTNMRNSQKDASEKDKINLDYDWNSEYGDGDIPDIDK